MTAQVAPCADASPPVRRWPVITVLGLTQIFAWGSTYYLPAVLAAPIAAETGWPVAWVVGGLSLGLLVAGAVSPWVGRAIARLGGRPVLAVSAFLLSAGLLGLGTAPNLPAFLGAWLVMGLGMGAGLYDPAFATLGRLFGQEARSAITSLTLFGGFASTVCWPLSAYLAAHLGWRGTCLAYAGFQLAIALPIYLKGLPHEPRRPLPPLILGAVPTGGVPVVAPRRGVLCLLAAAITLASVISAVMSVHLLTVLQGKGLALASAVTLGALVGPSQVGARAIELAVARRHHPIWTKIAATSFTALGLAVLWRGGPLLTLALVLYGAGIGLESIARGTLPLAIVGPARYPVLMGRIGLPNLIAQAAAPSLGALLLAHASLNGSLAVMTAGAVVNVLLSVLLGLRLRGRMRPNEALRSS